MSKIKGKQLDITNLIKNGDFSEWCEHWDDKWAGGITIEVRPRGDYKGPLREDNEEKEKDNTDIQDAMNYSVYNSSKWVKDNYGWHLRATPLIKECIEVLEKQKEDINMSIIKKLFDVEIGEEFHLHSDCYFNAEMKFHFDKYLDVCYESGEPTLINPLDIQSGSLRIVKIEKPILDDVEKKFIGNIIRPFDVKDIMKVKCEYNDKLFITIRLTNSEEIPFPYFSSNSKMYKGMKIDKPYTPEELGL